MAVHLHRAPRAQQLAEMLGELLSSPLPDPLAQEVVVVPAKGVERWLTQRLSHRLGVGRRDGGQRGGDGVCAGVRFLHPRSLISLLLDRERDDVWDPDRLVWPVLSTIDAHLDEPWCAGLARHLGHGMSGDEAELRRDRRYSVAHRLARLFSSYAEQRPTLIRDWREGRDTDGLGAALAGDLAWQPELWRRVLDRVEEDPPDVRHERTVSRLAAGGQGLDLPDRLSLLGHTRLPVTEVELLAALGRHRDVHLLLPQASPALWDELSALGERGLGGPVPRDQDESVTRVHHPLLASLGRDSRELRRTLDRLAAESAEAKPPPLDPTPPGGDSDTLLGWLQHDLRANAAPIGPQRADRIAQKGDRSLQVHACHSPARQVDVLREVLVGLLEDQPDLEPRDILVMCPNVETYAPLIAAGFGLADVVDGAAGGGHPAHQLRVRLADRALVSTNPLLGLASTLLELAGGRVTASEVLDLLGKQPCRRRFGLSDDHLDRISGWVAQAGIRWGLDASHRAAYAMQGFGHNTWRAGLDRVLLGVAMSGDDHAHLGRGLPLDDVGSNDVELAGRLAEFLDRLTVALDTLTAATSASQWLNALHDAVRGLSDVSADDAWQLPQLERELARAVDDSAQGELEGETDLRLADARAMLAHRLGGRPTRANFRTGILTVCTMTPMRSVPHRVVCLMGLDDGAFPRQSTTDGDDVLARRPVTGERDARSEDRQLLLDAILSASETVVITYTGANEHTGARRPPAVPLGEILDMADRTAAEPVRHRIWVQHPLQPHNARNHVPGALVGSSAFSFDHATAAGAAAAAAPTSQTTGLLIEPLSPRPADGSLPDVSLADLRAFLVHPVRSFLRGRLDVAASFAPDELSDDIPITLDGLEKWQIGDRLLSEALSGQQVEAVLLAEQLRGSLPPGQLGLTTLHQVANECQALLDRTADLRRGDPQSIDVDIELGGGRRLTGTVSGVFTDKLFTMGYSRLKPKQRLLAWVDLLALSAARPDSHWTSHAVGKSRAGPQRALAGPVDHRAVEWLDSLVALRDLGQRLPLPVPIATGAAWAQAHAQQLMGADGSPIGAARREWTTDPHNSWGFKAEDADAYHRLAFGGSAPLEVLLDAGLATYAWQIWEPLLSGAERVGAL